MKVEDQSDSTVQQSNDSTSVEKCCEKCGRFDAIEIGDKFLCENCITEAGCACAEREIESD